MDLYTFLDTYQLVDLWTTVRIRALYRPERIPIRGGISYEPTPPTRTPEPSPTANRRHRRGQQVG